MLAQTTPAAKKAPGTTVKKTPEPPLPPRPDGLYALINVTHGGKPVGQLVARLFEKESPITVKNFVDLALGRKSWLDPKTRKLARRPFYNGLTFHRVIPGFMIQGGDPLGNGSGSIATIQDEYHPSLSFNRAGLFAMANSGVPNDGSCQFFITERPTPHLEGKHPIFGELVEGLELAASLARVARGLNDKPTEPIVMTKVAIVRYPLGQPVGPIIQPVPAKKSATKKASPASK